MSEENKTILSPGADARKTEINKGILLFNRMGIWMIAIVLLVAGTIIAAQKQYSVHPGSCGSLRDGRRGIVLCYLFRQLDGYVDPADHGNGRHADSTEH